MVRIVVCRRYAPGSNPLIFDWIFFSFKIEETCTLTTFVNHKLSLSQSILTRHMIVWSAWHSSIWKKLLKKISDCRSFSVLKILTGYRPYSSSLYYFPSKFPSVLRGNHSSSIRATSPKFVSCIYQKLNITALQNCLNWCLIRDMVGQVNVVFSWSFLQPILWRRSQSNKCP